MMEMAEQMQALGWQADLLDGRTEEGYEQRREQIIQKQYDVIFTINGMILEEDSVLGEALLRKGDVIYCTYLMDHPLIHYQRLRTSYPAVFVLSPDRYHTAYTDRYLSNIWGTAFLPHAGCRYSGAGIPYQERTIDLSFMGSYIPPEQIRMQFREYPEEMALLLETTADILMREPERTLEDAVLTCLAQYGITMQDNEMPAVLAEFRMVDRYIRSYYRDAVIRTLVDAGICVDVYGDGWEQFATKAGDCLRVHPAVSYEESLAVISDSRISLNIMPWFKDGSHDRVFTAMLNGALCLTDGSAYLEEELRETENVYFYSLKGLKYLPAKIRRILSNPEQSAAVAAAGRELAQGKHTWAHRAEEVMDYLEQLASMQITSPDPGLIPQFYQEVVGPNRILMQELSKVIQYLRCQDYFHAMKRTAFVLDRFSEVLPAYIRWKDVINGEGLGFSEEALLSTMQEILDAQQRKDYVWLADLFALKLLPLVRQIQECYAGIAPEIETGSEDHRIELTSSGAYTLAVKIDMGWQYLHTNDNPYEEGRILAQSWFDGEHYEYIVYGLGLGYHIQALLDMDIAITVTVLEADPAILSLAEEYGVVQYLKQSGRVRLIPDQDGSALVQTVEEIRDTQRFVIHYPSLGQIANPEYREWLEEYFIEYSSAQTQLPRMTGNFVRNRKNFGREVSELRDQFAGKTVYIVAAGPSLDCNMQELKNVGEEGVILATGTVLKKLLAAEIHPDYVIVIDAGKTTYVQTEGLQETEVPLLYLSTVYYQIPAEYPGEKYVILQKDYGKSEAYAREHGYEVYATGGSVTTTALELGIRLGAARIVLVGADLAYTDGRNHAADTAYAKTVENDTACRVEDIHGGQVMTAKNLTIYRKWIEKRIQQAKDSGIRFVDATEGGARIHGTELAKLKDVVAGKLP
ncbi:MAG: DUF115 domain-containing protein [Lachnospiraceae bacterium]|nr:DUF115 domain-containing protein [Lachnospiraceae bacterium]